MSEVRISLVGTFAYFTVTLRMKTIRQDALFSTFLAKGSIARMNQLILWA
jgi:hypothetical protein